MPLDITVNGKLASLMEVIEGLKRGPKKNDRTIDWPIKSIKVQTIKAAQVTALAKALEKNNTLVTLDLSDRHIGPDGVTAFAEVLKTSSALTTLDLTNNNIGDEGAAALAVALEGNSALTTLVLPSNGIGPAGAATIATALARNSTLTTLDFAHNNIGDDGAAVLAEALKVNGALKHLRLTRNNIGDGGAAALATALEKNDALTTLDFLSNRIGPAGAVALAAALEGNISITALDIGWGYVVGSDTVSAIDRMLNLSKNIATKLSDSLKSSKKPFLLTDQEREYIATPAGVLRVVNNFLKQNPDVVLDEEFQKRIIAASSKSFDGQRLLANAIAAMADDRVFSTLKKLPKSRGFEATLDDFVRVAGDKKVALPLPDFVQKEILKFLGTDAIKVAESSDAGAAVGIAESRSRGGGGGGSGSGDFSGRAPRRTARASSGTAVAPPLPPRFPWR